MRVDNTNTTWDDDKEYELFIVSDQDYSDFISKSLMEKYKKLKVSNFSYWREVMTALESKEGGMYITDKANAEYLIKNTPKFTNKK